MNVDLVLLTLDVTAPGQDCNRMTEDPGRGSLLIKKHKRLSFRLSFRTVLLIACSKRILELRHPHSLSRLLGLPCSVEVRIHMSLSVFSRSQAEWPLRGRARGCQQREVDHRQPPLN